MQDYVKKTLATSLMQDCVKKRHAQQVQCKRDVFPWITLFSSFYTICSTGQHKQEEDKTGHTVLQVPLKDLSILANIHVL